MSEHKAELLNNPYGQVNYEMFRKADLVFVDKGVVIKFLDDKSMIPCHTRLCYVRNTLAKVPLPKC